ncbi:isomerase [Photobacterium phosphoreum]|nr:isomerase [Photobacterium phosphoreum]
MNTITPIPEAVRKLAQLYEQLSPATLEHLDCYYAPNARFKDPFNEVEGIPAIRHIFEHMFATLEAPRFVVTESVVQGEAAFLIWEFHFLFRRWNRHVKQRIHGATHVLFDKQGRVVLHRDYWDAAEELYEKLPVLGGFMRWLRRHASR